jgi:hypothetical protein
MAETPLEKLITTEEAAQETKRLEKLKGDQYDTVNAWADPDSFFTMKLPESVIKYYKITKTITGAATPYQSTKESNKKENKSKIIGASMRSGAPKGKLIKLPVNPASVPTDKIKSRGGKQYDRKFFYIRIPQGMSINALSVWINNQFTANKPKYFVSPSGKKWYLNDFKDKAQLNQIGKKK